MSGRQRALCAPRQTLLGLGIGHRPQEDHVTLGSLPPILGAEGLRESTESWADLLRDCRRHGMRDPELVVGDGAMGLWKAPAEVFPAAL